MKSNVFKLALAEPSDIIRNGLAVLLKRMPGNRISLVEIPDMAHLHERLKADRPDLLLVNPAMLGCFTLSRLKEECGCASMKCIALLCSASVPALMKPYDEIIHLYDDELQIRHKLSHCFESAEEEGDDTPCTDEAQCLSVREKEIVICVVKGLTNKEIAEKLYLSTHTVITHRRNIAKKLQIHSASGLTIYAIVNKLVELDDIKDI